MKQDPKFLVVTILLIAVIAYCFFFHGGSEAELNANKKTSHQFAAESIKAITGSWSTDELQQRAHRLLMEGVKQSGNSLDEYFKVLSQLGTLNKDGDCKFLNVASVLTEAARYATASYLCAVEYSNGPANIGVEVRQDNMTGPWQIVNFQVNSPFFSQKTGNPKEDTNQAPKKEGNGQ